MKTSVQTKKHRAWLVLCIGFFSSTVTQAQSLFQSGNLNPVANQETAPGMIFIEGQSFYFSSGNENAKRTLAPFYISACEESNGQYMAYLNFLKRFYSKATYQFALPDTMVWCRENLNDALKAYLTKNYLRSECFRDYPVVGLTKHQIKRYAMWKSDRLNEMILVREGVLDNKPMDSSDVFTTQAYLEGSWRGLLKKLPGYHSTEPEREIRLEEGLFSPNYRLPTNDEWYWACYAMCNFRNSGIKTPKEIHDKKMDKSHAYDFLVVKQHKHKNCPAQVLSPFTPFILKEAYNTKANAFKLKGMDENVSELTLDSTQNAVVMGTSWKDLLENRDNDSTKVQSGKALNVSASPIPIKPSAALGFRLAMDYTGPLSYPVKRKRLR